MHYCVISKFMFIRLWLELKSLFSAPLKFYICSCEWVNIRALVAIVVIIIMFGY